MKYDALDASGKCSQVQLCANRKAMSTSAHRLSYSDKLTHVQVVITCRYSLAQLCIQEDIHTRLFRRSVLDDIMSQNEQTTMIMSIWVTASYQTLFLLQGSSSRQRCTDQDLLVDGQGAPERPDWYSRLPTECVHSRERLLCSGASIWALEWFNCSGSSQCQRIWRWNSGNWKQV